MDPTTIQPKLDAIAEAQKSNGSAQFNLSRFAILLKPGAYPTLDVKIGFYTQVSGLGLKPDDTAVSAVHCNFYGNVTQTFWRAMENVMTTGKECYWGVSQGTSFRRIHTAGGLKLHSEGWASGGFMADCKITGGVNSGSQQQWLSRNTEMGRWSNAVWNMVFVGVPNAPTQWPSYTSVEKTPVIAEKPFLYFAAGKFAVMVPALEKNTQGASWSGFRTAAPGKSIPIEQFYIAHAGRDTAATINAMLAKGANLILTPGIYPLEASIKVTRPGTVVMGMGYATLKPVKGTPAMQIADVDGVRVSSILFDAAPGLTPTLLEVGPAGSKLSHAANPTIIYDIFCRVGGGGPGDAAIMTTINSNDVIGDNTWLWRADHGAGWSWKEAKNKNALVVNGNNVTYYGLAVEHTQEYQTLWNGEGGRVYFYQSEIPYDVPDQKTWGNSGKGWSSYKVADNVKTHEAWGLGIYSLFNAGQCVLQNAYEVPKNAPGVKIHHMNAINLGGKAGGGSGIAHVINDVGDPALSGSSFKRSTLAEWPVPPPTAP
ncbi:MAG: coagulation factor 5/8 type domain-containing protein [Chthoniobacterales bacterium]